MNESNTNDVQQNEDYVEMVQSDVNCITGHSSNIFSFSGGQPSRFHQSQQQMHQMRDSRIQYNQFLLGQHLIHRQAYSGMTPPYISHSRSFIWGYQY